MLLALAVPAHADTNLVGSAPLNGATVTSRPTSVTLDFQDRIVGQPVVAVTGPDGARVVLLLAVVVAAGRLRPTTTGPSPDRTSPRRPTGEGATPAGG